MSPRVGAVHSSAMGQSQEALRTVPLIRPSSFPGPTLLLARLGMARNGETCGITQMRIVGPAQLASDESCPRGL